MVGEKGLYEGFTESIPFVLNPLAIAYGEVVALESFLRRSDLI